MDLTREELIKKIKDLPQDLQDAFFSEDVSEAILDIGKKFELRVDKIGELGDETSSVMLGLTSPKDYIKNLAERLGVDQIKTREIAEEINQKVFQKVRESLKKIHGLAPPSSTPGGKLQPEIINPSATRIAIKTEKEEMERIEIPDVMPGIFAKKIDVPPHLAFPMGPKLKSIDELLNMIEPRGKTLGVESQKIPSVEERGGVKSDIEKVLGGEIRQGTDPYREPI